MVPIDPPKPPLSPWQALGLVGDIGVQIALPTVGFALLGRWCDKRYGTSPFGVILGLAVALVVVGVLIVKQGKDIAKRL